MKKKMTNQELFNYLDSNGHKTLHKSKPGPIEVFDAGNIKEARKKAAKIAKKYKVDINPNDVMRLKKHLKNSK